MGMLWQWNANVISSNWKIYWAPNIRFHYAGFSFTSMLVYRKWSVHMCNNWRMTELLPMVVRLPPLMWKGLSDANLNIWNAGILYKLFWGISHEVVTVSNGWWFNQARLYVWYNKLLENMQMLFRYNL